MFVLPGHERRLAAVLQSDPGVTGRQRDTQVQSEPGKGQGQPCLRVSHSPYISLLVLHILGCKEFFHQRFTKELFVYLFVCVQISELEGVNFSLEEMLMEAKEGEGEEGEEGEEVDGGREERRGRSATLIETALKEKDEVKILLSSFLLQVLPAPFFPECPGFFLTHVLWSANKIFEPKLSLSLSLSSQSQFF